MKSNKVQNMDYISDIIEILNSAKKKVYTAVNSAMVQAYWLIGRRIVEEEQSGKDRAEYGKQIIDNLSDELSKEFGQGFSARRIREIRQFYFTFPLQNIWRTLRAESIDEKWHSPSAELENNISSTAWSQWKDYLSHILCAQSAMPIKAEIEREKLNYKLQFGGADE